MEPAPVAFFCEVIRSRARPLAHTMALLWAAHKLPICTWLCVAQALCLLAQKCLLKFKRKMPPPTSLRLTLTTSAELIDFWRLARKSYCWRGIILYANAKAAWSDLEQAIDIYKLAIIGLSLPWIAGSNMQVCASLIRAANIDDDTLTQVLKSVCNLRHKSNQLVCIRATISSLCVPEFPCSSVLAANPRELA